IWILESYPNSKKWWSKKANVIPRGLAWSKVTMFEKSDYEELFGPMSNPNVALISSPEEMSQAWFKASAEFIKGLDDQDGTFFQDDQVDDGDGVLDSQSDDGDGVLDSQTKDVIEQAAMLPTMSSNSPQAGNAAVSEFFAEFDALKKEVLLIKRRKDDEFDELTKRFSKLETSETFVKFKKLLTNDLCTENESSDCNQKKSDGGVSIEEKPNFSSHHNDSSNHIGGVSSEAKASSSSAHPGNDEDVSHLDDNMEIDGQNAKDGYSNSQHHLHLLIKALGSKIENPMYMMAVDSYDDDYMSLFNDEEQPGKSSLNDLELQQEPDKVDVKDGILNNNQMLIKEKQLLFKKLFGGATNLSRPDGCKSDKVTVPEYMSAFITNKDLPEFWLRLFCLNIGKLGWLTDQHLDLCIDLMWSLRPPEADWAIVSPHFSTCILNRMMSDYFLNGHMYPLPWIAVEKVYFPVKEPKEHWCLAELEIRIGVVTFYDSLGWAGRSRRRWWRRMKKVLPEKLTLYLRMHGIFDSKGISADDYKITYNYASVPFHASLYGDCGIWVCIFIYRLCRNLSVAVDNDPLETALAYRERMLEFFWNHKILVE
ncbi:phospholipase-like protein, partial [Tanacetum coccineum]